MTGMTGMWAEGHDKAAGRISHHSLPLPFPSGNKKIYKKNNQHLKRGVTISQAEAEQLQFGPDCKRSFGRF